MTRIVFALLLAGLAAHASAQQPRVPVQVEGRSLDASAAGQTTTRHGLQAIDDATAAAVIGALQTRFDGQQVEFRLGEVSSERVNLSDIALHGHGAIRLGARQGWLPIRFDALYDSDTQVVESPTIVLGDARLASAD